MKTKYGKKLTKKLVSKIFITTIIYTIIFIISWFILRALCSSIIWMPDSFLYEVLTVLGYSPVAVIFAWIIGFVIIVIYYLQKYLSYIDAIVNVSNKLADNTDTWIKLPDEISSIEEKLNEVKQNSLKNYRLAKDAEQKKNDLLVYLAHDIKTPLTSMIGYLSLLDEIDDMPLKQRKKYIRIALEKSYKLEELINELFEITRFNSSKIILEKGSISLNLMLEQIIDDFYPILKENDKQINLKIAEPITIKADSDKLARVFNNVIKNAINYSTTKDININVTKTDNKVNIAISNQGNKIPKEKLDRIFEKFYRLDKSRNTKTGGSGLGLAIAKEIVQLHRGTITAESTDELTTFNITLPLK